MPMAIYAICLVLMNIFANKSISFTSEYIALDAGTFFSWYVFLMMDTVTKRFGAKAANEIAIVGFVLNMCASLMFFFCSSVPGVWSESFSSGAEDAVNAAIDNTFRGTWFVILGSAIAFLTSAFVNNFLNAGIGALIKKDDFISFCFRTYSSTIVGQFVDNFIFSMIVSHTFFGWSIVQCISAAFLTMLIEVLFELIFAPLGYHIARRWERDGIGKEYLALRTKA